jgi:hypothetical protein
MVLGAAAAELEQMAATQLEMSVALVATARLTLLRAFQSPMRVVVAEPETEAPPGQEGPEAVVLGRRDRPQAPAGR